MSEHSVSRRKFITAAVYTAPVILTLKAAPTFAKSGSMPGRHRGHSGRHQVHQRRRQKHDVNPHRKQKPHRRNRRWW